MNTSNKQLLVPSYCWRVVTVCGYDTMVIQSSVDPPLKKVVQFN